MIRHVLGLGMVSVGVAARSSHVVVARHIAAQRVSATGEANMEVQARVPGENVAVRNICCN